VTTANRISSTRASERVKPDRELRHNSTESNVTVRFQRNW